MEAQTARLVLGHIFHRGRLCREQLVPRHPVLIGPASGELVTLRDNRPEHPRADQRRPPNAGAEQSAA